jgi:hypothetical protein
MGQSHTSRKSFKIEESYFSNKRKEMTKCFTGSQVFLEYSSEWLVIIREELSRYKCYSWYRPIKALIKHWKSFQDSSSRVAFIWKQYQTSKHIPRIDQNKCCIWPQSISSLQTFTYEVELDPDKKTLNNFLSISSSCTLSKLIKVFRRSFFDYYCEVFNEKTLIRHVFELQVGSIIEEIDQVILHFIQVIIRVLPKFFINFPASVDNIEGIVRNAVVSDEILKLLVVFRRESLQDLQNHYLKGLQIFGERDLKNPILDKLESNNEDHYLNALFSVLSITDGKSIGQIHDSVAMLMNYISLGLFDEENPDNIIEDDELIQVFLFVIGRSSTPDLPVYINILNKFLDNNTRDIKAVGQGITKLTYILDRSNDWESFVSVKDSNYD